MRCVLRSLLLLACTVLVWAQEEGEAEIDYCFRPSLSEYNVIFEEAFEFRLGNATTYVNCMSFGENRELKIAVVSGRNEAGGTEVFEFVCRGNGLLAFDSSRAFSTVTVNNTCVECSDAVDACSARKWTCGVVVRARRRTASSVYVYVCVSLPPHSAPSTSSSFFLPPLPTLHLPSLCFLLPTISPSSLPTPHLP